MPTSAGTVSPSTFRRLFRLVTGHTGFSAGFTVVAMASCTADDLSRRSGAVVHDSLGIEIVTSTPVIGRDSLRWRVTAQPTLTIRTEPSASGPVIHWVRGVARLADGTIVSVSETSRTLDFFAPDGKHRRSVGGNGDGPGELRGPTQLLRTAGDTLIVEQRGALRRDWFDASGRYIRRASVEQLSVQALAPAGFGLGRNRLISPRFTLWEIFPFGYVEPGARRARRRGYALSADAPQLPRILGWFSGLEHFFLTEHNGRFAFFARDTYAAAGGAPLRIYIGDSGPGDIQVFDTTGALVRIIRDAIPPSPITEADITSEKAELTEWGRMMGRIEEVHRLADAMPLPEQKPRFEDLIVDTEGYLWVKEYSSYRPEPVRYRVYDATGARIAVVRLPGRLRVFEIGSDYVLGVEYDSDWAESIQSWSLRRDAGVSTARS